MPAAMHIAGHHTQWNRTISFADQVVHCWPPRGEALLVLAVADRRDVVDEGVEPDGCGAFRIPGPPHARDR